MRMSASRWPKPECTPPSETSPSRCTRSAPSKAARSTSFSAQRAVGDRLVDPGQVLGDDRPRAEVQVPDLGVAHLPVGQPDAAPAGLELRVGVCGPQLVEHRRLRERDGVARPGLGQPPAVEDHEARPRDRERVRAGGRLIAARPPRSPRTPSGSRLAPPTSAPSTSGRASSSRGVVGLDAAAVEDPHALGGGLVDGRRRARG